MLASDINHKSHIGKGSCGFEKAQEPLDSTGDIVDVLQQQSQAGEGIVDHMGLSVGEPVSLRTCAWKRLMVDDRKIALDLGELGRLFRDE